jgi:hypothetical protein
MVSHEDGCLLKFHARLFDLDQAAAERVRSRGCPHCGGPLYVSNIPRKVRGLRDEAVTAGRYKARLSFCCGREGCRRRATPPSVRFALRRVYAAVAVLGLCLRGLTRTFAVQGADLEELRSAPAPSTRHRWSRFWRAGLWSLPWFAVMRGHLGEPVEQAGAPDGLLEVFRGPVIQQITDLLRWLSPLTTGSVAPETSRLVMAP